MSEIKIDDLILRHATIEDLAYFDELAGTVHFDVGLHNWKLYYSVCPEEFRVFVDSKNDKIVGILTGNALNDKFFWGHQIVLLPQYRSKHRFERAISQIQHQPYFGGNRNANSIQALRSFPCHFGHKQVGFYGRVNIRKRWTVNPPEGVKILKLDNDPSKVDQKLLQNLYKYDDSLYENIPVPKRRDWLKKWLFPEDPNHSVAVVAYNSDNCTVYGFGVGRVQTKEFSSISPLYADSDQIAYPLLCEIANNMKCESIYMEFGANRRICFQFVQEANLIQTYSNFRVYIPYTYNFPIHKLYCDNEFWPM